MAKPLNTAALRELLAVQASTPSATPPATASSGTLCTCGVGMCLSWESVPEERWPSSQLPAVASLRDPELYEPTFEQYHPAGTNYDSPESPIAPSYFPYNRCELHHCQQCQRHLLRYTEFGGYYVDHRVRWARLSCVVEDAPPPSATA